MGEEARQMNREAPGFSRGESSRNCRIFTALAVQVRRLHDIGRSGWWVFIALVPLVGAIVLFVFDVLPSENGANRYGQEPVTGSASGPLQF